MRCAFEFFVMVWCGLGCEEDFCVGSYSVYVLEFERGRGIAFLFLVSIWYEGEGGWRSRPPPPPLSVMS